MSESWDQYAEGWDSNADVILYSERAFDSLCKLVNLEGLSVLDFGCGTGLLTERMAQKANQILGLDSSEKMISVLQSKQLNNVETLVADISEEAIKSSASLKSKYDLIVASSVCAFLPDYEGTLQLLKTLLKPNGTFVQWDWLKEEGESGFGLDEKAIETALSKSGMKIIKIEKTFSLESKEGLMQVIMGVAKNA